jgi:hypothetical protein
LVERFNEPKNVISIGRDFGSFMHFNGEIFRRPFPNGQIVDEFTVTRTTAWRFKVVDEPNQIQAGKWP